jgi:hypothetical protein
MNLYPSDIEQQMLRLYKLLNEKDRHVNPILFGYALGRAVNSESAFLTRRTISSVLSLSC